MIPLLAAVLALSTSPAPPTAAASAAQISEGIAIVNAQFGALGLKQKLDITARLQQLCGTTADSCSVFCSETSFGVYRLGRKPICRVIYRCPDHVTRSTEAAREEPILLGCRLEEDGDGLMTAPSTTTDVLQPPPYIPTPAGN